MPEKLIKVNKFYLDQKYKIKCIQNGLEAD
jgi:hypothetical protein